MQADGSVGVGQIVLVDLRPVRGTEQDGTRPALVISEPEMHEFTRRAVVCPITRDRNPWPTKVFLPEGLKTEGAVLVDQVRSIDRAARIVRIVETVPRAVLLDVRTTLAALLGLPLPTDAE